MDAEAEFDIMELGDLKGSHLLPIYIGPISVLQLAAAIHDCCEEERQKGRVVLYEEERQKGRIVLYLAHAGDSGLEKCCD